MTGSGHGAARAVWLRLESAPLRRDPCLPNAGQTPRAKPYPAPGPPAYPGPWRWPVHSRMTIPGVATVQERFAAGRALVDSRLHTDQEGALKTASWVILTIVAALIILFSLVSAWRAYGGSNYFIGPKSLAQIAAAHEGVGPALRAIRGTSAAYASAYGVLFLAIVLGPYRRSWAWWAILAGLAALAIITALRVPTLGVAWGVQGALTQLAVVLVGLLLDVGRVRASRLKI